MAYVLVENNTIVQKQPDFAEGFISAPDYVVCGMVFNGHEFVNPTPPEPTLEERKEALKNQISKYGEQLMRSGYHTTTFGPEETLQLRDQVDERNWMASLGAYTAAVVAGQGATEGAVFRTTANNLYTLSFSDGMGLLVAMQQWCAQLMQTSWAKQDAIMTAEDNAALDILESQIEEDWP